MRLVVLVLHTRMGGRFRSASRGVVGPHPRGAFPDTRLGHQARTPRDQAARLAAHPRGPNRSSALLGPNTAGHWTEPRLTWFSARTAESVTAGPSAPSRIVQESPALENHGLPKVIAGETVAKLPAITVMTEMPQTSQADVDNLAGCCHGVRHRGGRRRSSFGRTAVGLSSNRNSRDSSALITVTVLVSPRRAWTWDRCVTDDACRRGSRRVMITSSAIRLSRTITASSKP
jgi:hypothetical protein